MAYNYNEDELETNYANEMNMNDEFSCFQEITEYNLPDTTSQLTEGNQKKSSKKSKKSNKKKYPKHEATVHEDNQLKEIDMSEWEALKIPSEVITVLQQKGYHTPTPIQKQTILPAIKDRIDILGAAETGSGKTLAFGIPLIVRIMEAKNGSDQQLNDEYGSQQESIQTETSILHHDEDLKEDDDDEIQQGVLKMLELNNIPEGPPLYGLIVTPTRELALQIHDHLKPFTKHVGLRTCVVVGGLREEKQLRMLKKWPEIVIGTPGRLWKLLEMREPHIIKVSQLKFLVIDEADRMLDQYSFHDLKTLLLRIRPSFRESESRDHQTFFFSATLSMAHVPRNPYGTKKVALTKNQKLKKIMQQVGIRSNAKIVDLSKPTQTASKLLETKILCPADEQENYLYYLLYNYPGRTLVFCNSVSTVRRLTSLFKLLQRPLLPLHGHMPMRCRLKSLDKFKDKATSVLVSTDVAARGLDICNVEHVIHYHVPKTVENYVHRSGRTARAQKDGLSVMLVSVEDMGSYKNIIRNLRDTDIPAFPLNIIDVMATKKRIRLAKAIYKKESGAKKKMDGNRWLEQVAKEMDIDIQEADLLNKDLSSSYERKRFQREINQLRYDLEQELDKPLERKFESKTCITSSGKLNVPYIMESGRTAIEIVRENQAKRDPINLEKGKRKRKSPWFIKNKKQKH